VRTRRSVAASLEARIAARAEARAGVHKRLGGEIRVPDGLDQAGASQGASTSGQRHPTKVLDGKLVDVVMAGAEPSAIRGPRSASRSGYWRPKLLESGGAIGDTGAADRRSHFDAGAPLGHR